MTDTEYKEQKARVERHCERWFRAIGLGWWFVTYTWKRETANYETRESYHATAALTKTQWQYRKAEIDWHLDVIAQMDEEELELLVVHEFVHILTDALPGVIKAADQERKEYVTESLARAIMYARRADYNTVEGEY